ncbi:hypothetical protein BC830DRAFT_641192 [Chytriomyces sp. MP71]|nr:hypothetical protein BC830DRAFT_641192 [Chytriomyces sp. MP71]
MVSCWGVDAFEQLFGFANVAFAASCIAVMAWCIKHGVVVPSPVTRPTRLACRNRACRQRTANTTANTPSASSYGAFHPNHFRLHLLCIALFYLFELLSFALEPSLAAHHLVAFALFSVFWLDSGNVALTSVSPALAHAIFWVLYALDPTATASHLRLLLAYNVIGYAAAITCLINSFTLVAWDRLARSLMVVAQAEHWQFTMRSPHALGFLVLIEVCINYFSYCDVYMGDLCPSRGSDHFYMHLVAICAAFFVFSTAMAWLASFLMVLDYCAPLAVLVGQHVSTPEKCGDWIWCTNDDTEASIDYTHVRGFRKIKAWSLVHQDVSEAARKVKEE